MFVGAMFVGHSAFAELMKNEKTIADSETRVAPHMRRDFKERTILL
jgi:hypothetical protein